METATKTKQPWSTREHEIFLSLIPIYGRNFRAYETLLPGRKYNQLKSYYHNNKLGLPVHIDEAYSMSPKSESDSHG